MSSRSIYKLLSLAGTTPFYLLAIMVAYLLLLKTAIDLAISFILLMGVCYSIKLVYRKPRPDANERPAGKSWIGWLDAASFPSVHSARAAALSICVLALMTSAFVATAAVIFTICVGFSRIKLRRHFLTDVIGGVIIGGTLAFLVTRFH